MQNITKPFCPKLSLQLDGNQAAIEAVRSMWRSLRVARAVRPDLPLGGAVASCLISMEELEAEQASLLNRAGL
jgi:hypothetical protein